MTMSRVLAALRTIAAVALAACLFASEAVAESGDQKSLIKAAFIFNFARFTEWPEGSFAGARSKVRICYRSDDPLGDALTTIDGKQIGTRAIEVVRLDKDAGMSQGCHIAILPAAEIRGAAPAIRGLLTIADLTDLGQTDVAVGLIQIGRQIRFQVNTSVIAEADLRMSSKLLRLAAKVYQ